MQKEGKENPYNMKNGKDRKKEIKPGKIRINTGH